MRPTAVAFLLLMLVSWATAEFMDRYPTTRALFFGSAPDFKALTGLEANVSQPTELVLSGFRKINFRSEFD